MWHLRIIRAVSVGCLGIVLTAWIALSASRNAEAHQQVVDLTTHKHSAEAVLRGARTSHVWESELLTILGRNTWSSQPMSFGGGMWNITTYNHIVTFGPITLIEEAIVSGDVYAPQWVTFQAYHQIRLPRLWPD